MPSGRFTRSACALTAALVMAAAFAAPASADTGPNLKVAAVVQQGRWLPGDDVTVDLTVTNVGDAPAVSVHGSVQTQSGPFFYIRDASWGDLSYTGPGATFAPGESRTYHVKGNVGSGDGDPVIEIGAWGTEDVDGRDNTVIVTVPLVPKDTTDRIAGQLYGDRNEDGHPSPGEELAGAEAHLIGIGMSHDLVVVTDATGHFAFEGIPVNRSYYMHFEKIPDGWVGASVPELRADGSGANTALEVKTHRPLTDVLHETIELDKTSYAVGEVGKATVTIWNTGDRQLTGLYFGCDPGGFGQELEVPNAQWGTFNPEHPAGVLAAGQRIVFQVSGKVPEKSGYTGWTGLGCYVENYDIGYGPYTFDEAKVPGMRADSKGQVWVDKNGNKQPDAGEGVPNLTLVLVEDGKFVRSYARTDANGFATFKNVPVGHYRLDILGPWTQLYDPGVSVVASPYGYGDWSQLVVAK